METKRSQVLPPQSHPKSNMPSQKPKPKLSPPASHKVDSGPSNPGGVSTLATAGRKILGPPFGGRISAPSATSTPLAGSGEGTPKKNRREKAQLKSSPSQLARPPAGRQVHRSEGVREEREGGRRKRERGRRRRGVKGRKWERRQRLANYVAWLPAGKQLHRSERGRYGGRERNRVGGSEEREGKEEGREGKEGREKAQLRSSPSQLAQPPNW